MSKQSEITFINSVIKLLSYNVYIRYIIFRVFLNQLLNLIFHILFYYYIL